MMLASIALYGRGGVAICAVPIIGILALAIVIFRVLPLLSIKGARGVKVSQAKSGIVRLEGIARARAPLKSPTTGDGVVYYRTVLWHLFKYGEGGLFNERIFRGRGCAPFVLDDGTGRIEVGGAMPQMITIDKARENKFDFGTPAPKDWTPDMRKRADQYDNAYSFSGGKGYFYLSEDCIPDGAHVIVVAEVKDGRARPIILTDAPFYRVESDLMTELVGYSLAAFLCIAWTVGFGLMFYGMSAM